MALPVTQQGVEEEGRRFQLITCLEGAGSLTYLDNSRYLKCGFGWCFRCLDSLQKAPGAEGLLCRNCLVVSQKTDLRSVLQLRALVCKVKASSPS